MKIDLTPINILPIIEEIVNEAKLRIKKRQDIEIEIVNHSKNDIMVNLTVIE